MTKTDFFPVVAIIPSLNPDNKLLQVVNGILEAGFSDVILVDDGSKDHCQGIFDSLSRISGCTVIHHEVNKGKGRALKTAFQFYLENFDLSTYCGVVTADADGQHLPQDIYLTAQELVSGTNFNTNTMALGTRDFSEEQVPFKSRNGNRITTAVFQILYGKRINDTQTGLRAISNDFVQTCLNINGERFEYEINMLIQAVLKKIRIIEIPIQTVYFDDNRETHFHPVKDSFRIYRVMFASFFRFTCSGLLSMLVDQSLFALLQKIIFVGMSLVISIPFSTLIARVCSSLLNYSLNRSMVFQAKKTTNRSLIRYYILCTLQMAASAILVTFLNALTKLDSSLLKIVVDTFLFFVSYRIQRGWVFREENQQ